MGHWPAWTAWSISAVHGNHKNLEGQADRSLVISSCKSLGWGSYYSECEMTCWVHSATRGDKCFLIPVQTSPHLPSWPRLPNMNEIASPPKLIRWNSNLQWNCIWNQSSQGQMRWDSVLLMLGPVGGETLGSLLSCPLSHTHTEKRPCEDTRSRSERLPLPRTEPYQPLGLERASLQSSEKTNVFCLSPQSESIIKAAWAGCPSCALPLDELELITTNLCDQVAVPPTKKGKRSWKMDADAVSLHLAILIRLMFSDPAFLGDSPS